MSEAFEVLKGKTIERTRYTKLGAREQVTIVFTDGDRLAVNVSAGATVMLLNGKVVPVPPEFLPHVEDDDQLPLNLWGGR